MRPDPIELELFRHLLASVCEEMGIVLRKTAYSANIKERRDYSCAVYNHHGEAVAMGDHMPMHLGAMPASVLEVIRALPLDPGDVAILNDPFRGGTHLPDITAVSAVYLSGERRPKFYLANRAHHADVGGMSPGSMPLARDIYQEGLRIPPVYLVRRGEVARDVLSMILANVRTPEEREGDLLAQWMAIRRGEARLKAMARRYDADRVERNMNALMDYSERMMRSTLGRLATGCFRFTDYLDDDGVGRRPVKITVTLTLAGQTALVDFTGSDPQVAGPVNANYAVTVSAATYVFRSLVSEEVPFTAGLMRPVRIVVPEGTVVNARPPAAMAAGNVETSQRITDVLLGALSQAAPELIPAASSGSMSNVSIGGFDPFRQRPFAYYETIAGGMGASRAQDGISAVHTHMTNSWNTPVEALEHQFPMRIRAYRIRSASGGRGRRQGGDGIVREIELLAPCEVTILGDRRKRGPYGLLGGGPGKPGRNRLLHRGEASGLEGKARLHAGAGDVLVVETPGGGGYGRSASRAHKMVE